MRGRRHPGAARAGAEPAGEGRDIVRDPRRRDGEVTVTLTAISRGATSDGCG
ncbi:hypothetical protein [Streptomyces hawaiiensis]|uniref:hypothetical protein n=1 Tax=Streptomyces hawaiiensis TaxID=67305 RepID=UPI001586A196|nr:hypothetical protein [Streptomyces hawaiiensis]